MRAARPPPSLPVLVVTPMYRPTSPQLSLMESQYLVSAKKRARLERSWAEAFRTRVLPLVDEELFRSCFDAENGRPNASVRMLVGLHLLKEADDLTDEQVLDALEFNIQWQYALGVAPADAHVCEKTLHNFRRRMMQDDRAKQVFERLTEALVKVDGLSAVRQRLDSTHVISDIAVLTRLGLFTETVTHFLRDLRKQAPAVLSRLGAGLAERYLDREGCFADATREQAPRRLVVVAQDLFSLVRGLSGNAAVAALPSYGLLVRLLDEQCDVEEGAGEEPARVAVKDAGAVGGSSLQSPHDPDATYGHKGKGYEVQLAETCVAENPYQVVTVVGLNAANESDQRATVPVAEALVERGLAPEVLLADTAYGSGENLAACADLGVALLAPVPGRLVEPPRGGLGDFAFDSAWSEVARCPAGHAPVTTSVRADLQAYEAVFAGPACEACPLAGTCPTRPSGRGDGERVLHFRDVKAATATRQREQQTPEFKTAYRLRSGIESTNAEFKGRHGAGTLRVRGRDRVTLAVVLKVTALNAKRATDHHARVLRARLDAPAASQEAVE